MIKHILTLILILLFASSCNELDKKIEQALISNDWQQVYELLEKKNKYEKDPLHKFLMFQACFAIDCNLNIEYPKLDVKSLKKVDKWIEIFSSRNQNNIVSKHLLTELQLIKGNYNQAIRNSIEISDEDSSFLLTYNTRSNAFIAQRDYENALIDLNELIKQNPTHSKGYLYRAFVYDELQDYTNAIKDYNKSISLNPTYSMTYYNKGNTYRQLNNDSLAIKSFSKAIEYDSNNYSAYHNRGNTFFDVKDFTNSKRDYENFLKLAPKEMYNQKNIIKFKIETIENGGISFDEQKIEKIIANAYTAWANKDWEKFTSYIHPQALSRFKEALLPFYEVLFKDKDDREPIIVSGLILTIEGARRSSGKKFFETEAKLSNSKNNNSKDMSLPKTFIVNNIEQLSFELLSVKMYTTYINNYKQDEELGLMLDGAEWKILLPAPYMRVMLAMIEHFKK